MTKCLLPLLCGIAIGCNENRKAVDPIDGQWRVAAFHIEGTTCPVPEGQVVTFHFENGRIHFVDRIEREEDKTLRTEFQFTIDRSVQPNALTVFILHPVSGERIATSHGIFDLKGDRLTMVWNEGLSNHRPTEFNSLTTDDYNFVLFELYRVLPDL